MKVQPSDVVLPKREKPAFDSKAKCLYYTQCTSKCCLIAVVLFIYLCALNNLSTAFSLLGSRGLGKSIQDSPLINDPISAVLVGMIATVILQNPTTTSTVLVSMVAAEMITVHDAIPVMMGSDLGSTIVNSLVSLTYGGNSEEFGRAFSAATLADVFNVCCLFAILPLEIFFGIIEEIGLWIVDPLISEQGLSFKTIEYITDPINNFILEVNEEDIRKAITDGDRFEHGHSFILRCAFPNGTQIYNCPYHHIFAWSGFQDSTIGWIVLLCSIFVLISCLVAIVFLIQKLLEGRAGRKVNKMISKECPGRWRKCTGMSLMIIGLVITLFIQSNSIFSSSLTPLVGSGIISLDKMYPLILGSNIGATFSGLLAALSADASQFEKTLHMAVCQVVYNIMGTICFYFIPGSDRFPLYLASRLGDTVAQYRWFIVVFLLVFFILLPTVIIGLTLLPDMVIPITFSAIFILILIILFINVAQTIHPDCLPKFLQTWEFVPLYLRSLEPYDNTMTSIFTSIPLVGGFFEKLEPEEDKSEEEEDNSVDMELTVRRLSIQTSV